jgi:hypothetical protein
MKRILVLFFTFVLFSQWAKSQGCITIRNLTNPTGQYNLLDRSFTKSDWQIALTNRFFVANEAYTGTTYNKAASTFENRTYTFDISVTRLLNKGWSLNLDMPISANSRMNAAEHGGPGDNTTHSFGLNDIFLVALKWILPPHENQKFNFQLGLGLKLPTGNYNYQDYYSRNDTTKVLAPVSLSIQLGDGGTGLMTELNAFYVFSKAWSLYLNSFYLFNPRDQNGVSTLMGRTPTNAQILATATVTSVPDTYSARAGVSLVAGKWILSAGGRIEGSPVHDVIGQSNGLRRAGYNVSIEPGAMYNWKMVSVYYYMPINVAVNEMNVLTDQKLGNYKTTGGSAPVQFILGALFKL